MTSSPPDPTQSFALLLRERAIRDTRDALAALADSLNDPDGSAGWSGTAAEALRARLRDHRIRLRSVIPDLDNAEATVRRWRHGL